MVANICHRMSHRKNCIITMGKAHKRNTNKIAETIKLMHKETKKIRILKWHRSNAVLFSWRNV